MIITFILTNDKLEAHSEGCLRAAEGIGSGLLFWLFVDRHYFHLHHSDMGASLPFDGLHVSLIELHEANHRITKITVQARADITGSICSVKKERDLPEEHCRR